MRFLWTSIMVVIGILYMPTAAMATSSNYCDTVARSSYTWLEKCLEKTKLQQSASKLFQKPIMRTVRDNNKLTTNQNYLIHFENASSALTKQSQQNLALLINILQSTPMQNACLKLVGHSNAIGNPQNNMALSFERAVIVKRHIAHQYPQIINRIAIAAHGDKYPIRNISPKAPENRRVEIYARDCD